MIIGSSLFLWSIALIACIRLIIIGHENGISLRFQWVLWGGLCALAIILLFRPHEDIFGGEDPGDTPISLYAATKKANELIAHAYAHLYGIQTIGLRLFTIYGPWGRPDMAYWSFTEAMVKGEAISVFNQGNMRRDFTYITDIIAGIKSALFAEGLQQCEVFNLGNHRAEKLMDLIHLIAKELGVQPQLKMLPIQPGDVSETYADIEKARQILGFNPTTTLADGIPRFVRWYRDYHGVK